MFGLLIFILAFSFTASCPRRDLLYPCTCDYYGSTSYVKCSDIDNYVVLLNAANALRGMKNIHAFSIQNAVLNYMPHDLFDNIKLVELEFTSSAIMAFSDTDVAFKGLEDSLEKIIVHDCSYMNTWDWSLLKNMKKIERLDIIGGDMVSIDENVREINPLNMKYITFSRNEISYIHDYAFASFNELVVLTLSNNLIQEVKRSMLPNPAPNLLQIDLGYNEIEQLPDDFFENMPSLKVVSITKNKILTLQEKPFSPVWGQLERFLAMDNKLRCDCRISWIFERKMPKNIRATCDQPSKLKGQHLADLNPKDLWC